MPSSTSRIAYEMAPLINLNNNVKQLSSIAVVAGGERMFTGGYDGSLQVVDCRADTPASIRGSSFECSPPEVLRKPLSGGVGNKQAKVVMGIVAVPAWRSLLALIDGQLMAYDIQTFRPIVTVPETKGATCFCLNEEEHLIFIGNRRRVQVFSWQSVGVLPRRELPLGGAGAPQYLACCPSACHIMDGGLDKRTRMTICVALSKDYTLIDAVSGDTKHIPCISSSGAAISPPSTNAIILPFPSSSVRGPRLLLTMTGSKGVLVDVEGIEQEEIIAWSEAPVALQLSAVFLLAALPHEVVIHDCATLLPIQTLDITGTVVCMATCMMMGGRGPFGYIGTTDGIQLLKLIPVQFQVEALVDSGNYVEALTLCEMCKAHDEQRGVVSSGRVGGSGGDDSFLQNTAVDEIRERYARDLLLSGDYDGAVYQILKANVDIQDVISIFPSLLPPHLPIFLLDGGTRCDGRENEQQLQSKYSISDAPTLSRAASALVRFLEKRRMECVAEADREECQRAAATTTAAARNEMSRGGGDTTVVVSSSSLEESSHAICTVVLLDSVLIYAYLRCSPPRRQRIIDMLSSEEMTCRCDFDTIAPVLSGGGLTMLEPLLWLYRSKGHHTHALGLLSEEHCVSSGKGTLKADSEGEGIWTRNDFWQWTAEYLQNLWFSRNPVHPSLVLEAAVTRHLLGTRPHLGLTVFTGRACRGGKVTTMNSRMTGSRQKHRQPLGNVISPQQVVSFLKSVTVCPGDALAAEADDHEDGEDYYSSSSTGGRDNRNEIPLTTGRTLAIAYLDYLISSTPPQSPPLSVAGDSQNETSTSAALNNTITTAYPLIPTTMAMIHDELAYLLMEGVLEEQKSTEGSTPMAAASGAECNDSGGTTTFGSDAQVTLYRRKLRHFLQTSQQYNPARLLAVVPPDFLLEHALLLSRLGRHTEVLQIYVVQLRDRALAEKYCDRIWRGRQQEQCSGIESTSAAALSTPISPQDASTTASSSGDVYICLLQVYMSKERRNGPGGSGVGGRKEREDLQPVLDILTQFYDRIDPVKAMNLLPPDLPLVKLQPFLTATLRHHESRRCMAQATRHLNRADFVNIKYEYCQLQSQVSRVPELALSFEHLGKLVRSLPTEEVLEAGGGNEHRVMCTQHHFGDHLLLQFSIENMSEDVRLSQASIRCDPSDPDLLSVAGERPLEAVPPLGRGSCYVVRISKCIYVCTDSNMLTVKFFS